RGAARPRAGARRDVALLLDEPCHAIVTARPEDPGRLARPRLRPPQPPLGPPVALGHGRDAVAVAGWRGRRAAVGRAHPVPDAAGVRAAAGSGGPRLVQPGLWSVPRRGVPHAGTTRPTRRRRAGRSR